MENFGKYKIEEVIGLGGTATVYLATHTGLGRQVVLKVMSEQLFHHDIDYKKLFIDEAQTIARLQHPSIIQVYDVSVEDNRIYIEMEYLSGGTLKERVQKNLPINPIQVILDIAAALQYVIDASGIIHRDIKPSNIIFREQGDELTAVLTDFGIAKNHDSDSDFTNIGVRVGTPRYMSPEQLIGDTIDHRSDLYSLGIIFYELLSGEIYNKKLTHGAAGSFTSPTLPEKYKQLQPILNKLVTPDPNDRFNNAKELINALSKYKKKKYSKNSSPNSAITLKSKKVAIGASILLGSIIVFGGAFAFYTIQKEESEKKTSIEQIEIAILSLQQNETTANSVFALIKTTINKFPNEPKLKELSDKVKNISRTKQLRLFISNATQLIKNNELEFAEKSLSKAMKLSPSNIEVDEIEQILNHIQEKRIELFNQEKERLAKEKELDELGTMIISSNGFTKNAPILSKIENIKDISNWPKVRVSNNKPLYIQCLYQSPNNEIIRLHPYPHPESTYSSFPQQPGDTLDIPLGEEASGTSIITCIGSKKSLQQEFMGLFDSQYKLTQLSSIEQVSKYLKQQSGGFALIETTEVTFE